MPPSDPHPALLELIHLLAEAAVEEFAQEHETGETTNKEDSLCP